MTTRVNQWLIVAFATLLPAVAIPECPRLAQACFAEDPTSKPKLEARELSHEQTLRWVTEHRAWRLARKTKPIWARPVGQDEVGKEFQTADHAKETAREGYWLCVGVAGEPWFQTIQKIESKYEVSGEEEKEFGFDEASRAYRIYRPKAEVRNWVAQVDGPGISGFAIRPNYEPTRRLRSPAGGYVVMDEVEDPYAARPDDV
jgi:hypothetical protein